MGFSLYRSRNIAHLLDAPFPGPWLPHEYPYSIHRRPSFFMKAACQEKGETCATVALPCLAAGGRVIVRTNAWWPESRPRPTRTHPTANTAHSMARWPGPDPARSPTDRRKQCDKQGPSCPFLRSYVFVRFPGPHKVCNKVSLQSRLLFVQGRLGNDRYPSDHALESISIILCLFFIYFFSRIPPSLNAAPTAICYPSKGVYLEHTAYLCMPFRLVIQKCRSPPTGSKIMPWIPMRRNLFPTSLELLFSSALFSCLSNL